MINDKVRNRRLLLLADFLEKLPKKFLKTFHMGTWLETDVIPFRDGEYQYQEVEEKVLGECGTAACALGWGTRVPALMRAGLTQKAVRSDAYQLVESLFGEEAAWLFTSGVGARTPKQWAERTRRWVRDNPPQKAVR
jgi:hypothetical protein